MGPCPAVPWLSQYPAPLRFRVCTVLLTFLLSGWPTLFFQSYQRWGSYSPSYPQLVSFIFFNSRSSYSPPLVGPLNTFSKNLFLKPHLNLFDCSSSSTSLASVVMRTGVYDSRSEFFVKILLITSLPSLILPSLTPWSRSMGTTTFFQPISMALLLYCCRLTGRVAGLPWTSPYPTQALSLWTQALLDPDHRLLYIRTTSLTAHGMGHQNLPSLASPFLEAYGAIPVTVLSSWAPVLPWELPNTLIRSLPSGYTE